MDILLARITFAYTGYAKLAYAIVVLLAMYGLQIYLYKYMIDNRYKLDRPSTKESIGNLYDGLRIETTDKSPYAIEYYNIVFYFRRAIFIGITFSLFAKPGL